MMTLSELPQDQSIAGHTAGRQDIYKAYGEKLLRREMIKGYIVKVA